MIKKFAGFIKKLDAVKIFIYISLFLTVVFILQIIINFDWVRNSLLFIGGHDAFMDYFNVSAHISGFDPYNNVTDFFPANYPAMPYLLMIPFSLINSLDSYIEQPFYMQYLQDASPRVQSFLMPFALISFILYISLAVLLVVKLLKRYLNFTTKSGTVIALLFLSYPFLFAFERANVMIYSFIFMLYFLCFYNGEKPRQREFALFALAASASIKFYNLIYIMLVFKKGKLLPCLRCALYFVLLTLLPFLFFNGGFANIPLFINNFKTSLDGFHLVAEYSFLGHNYSLNATCVLAGVTNDYTYAPANILSYVLVGAGAIFSLAFKEEWKSLLLLTSVAVLFPVISYGYVLVLFTLPLISLLKSNDKNALSCIAMILLIIIFSPVQYGYLQNFYTLPAVANLVTALSIFASSIIMLCFGIKDTITVLRQKSLYMIIKEYFVSVKNEFARKDQFSNTD